MLLALVAVIALALVFDFVNGMHDSANSIATIVSTRVLSPGVAVAWAAFFNFVAFLLFESTVASNIAHGVAASVVSLTVVASGLVGALVWDLLTWRLALPSSSSHALLGGFAGAAVAKAGFGSLDGHFLGKTALFIVVSPVLGLLLGGFIMRLLMALFGRCTPHFVDRTFRRGQLLSAALYSLGHGGNDAQKTMGIITAALIATGHLHAHGRAVPLWVVLACHAAMALGTMTGGWRIVRTLGMGVAKLQPV
ncbi:MAG TPA: anion permease, partial [Polyangiaceae bacterium]